MAIGTIGGREYYSDIRELTSGETNCTTGGKVKGLLALTATNLTLHFSGGSVAITVTAGDILPFSPQGVVFATGRVLALL